MGMDGVGVDVWLLVEVLAAPPTRVNVAVNGGLQSRKESSACLQFT